MVPVRTFNKTKYHKFHEEDVLDSPRNKNPTYNLANEKGQSSSKKMAEKAIEIAKKPAWWGHREGETGKEEARKI